MINTVAFIKRLICTLAISGFWCLPIITHATDAGSVKMADKAMVQVVENMTELMTEEAVEEVVEKAVQKATERATEDAVEKAAEKAAEKAVQKVTERATEDVVEKAVEKATVKAAEAATIKSEQIAKRPDEWGGTTKVHYFIYVIDIDNIDDANQNFTANVYIRLRWKDPRLANPEGASRQVSMQEVWNPRILLANRQGIVSKSLPDVVDVHPDGTVLYHQRYTGNLSQILNLYAFPFDTHFFTIHFVSAGYTAEEVEFVADTRNKVSGGTMAEKLSLPDWEILKSEALELSYTVMGTAYTPGFAFRFQARRYFIYYFWQIVLPLTVVVVMSWAGFWVGREHIGVRIGVATSSILTLIAHRFVLANLLPRLPYMTRMDYFTVGCTLLVFLALIAVVATSFLTIQSRHNVYAQKLDIAARGVFPAIFIGLLLWFMLG